MILAGPQGIIGPTGPTGPTIPGYENAVGILWNNNPTTATFLENNAPLNVELNTAVLGLNVKYYDVGKIGIIYNGSYRIDYNMILQVSTATPQNVVKTTVNTIFNNQSEDSISPTVLNIDNNSYYYFNSTTVRNLNTGDTVGLIVKADKVESFTSYKAYLLITRIGEPLVRIPYEPYTTN